MSKSFIVSYNYLTRISLLAEPRASALFIDKLLRMYPTKINILSQMPCSDALLLEFLNDGRVEVQRVDRIRVGHHPSIEVTYNGQFFIKDPFIGEHYILYIDHIISVGYRPTTLVDMLVANGFNFQKNLHKEPNVLLVSIGVENTCELVDISEVSTAPSPKPVSVKELLGKLGIRCEQELDFPVNELSLSVAKIQRLSKKLSKLAGKLAISLDAIQSNKKGSK